MTDDDKRAWVSSAHPKGTRVVVAEPDLACYGELGEVVGTHVVMGDNTRPPYYRVLLDSGVFQLCLENELRFEQTFTFF